MEPFRPIEISKPDRIWMKTNIDVYIIVLCTVMGIIEDMLTRQISLANLRFKISKQKGEIKLLHI
jgi:hypothetical protein